MRRLFILGVLASTGLLAACSSDSAGTGATGGAGGAAGQPAGGAGGHGEGGGGGGGQAAGGGGGTAAGGAGGLAAGGAGGQALGGAGGGATVVCLDAATFASSFAIADSTFCAVALYTAPESIGYQIPTWGRHGGPLLVQPGASGAAGSSGKDLTLERWTPPAGATGAMTLQATTIASALPTGTYLGAQAVDLPFFGWTAISWVDAYPMTTGQIEMVASGAVATTFDVNGPYALVAVPAASSLGRLLYSGLSPLGMATTKTNGLYQADACSSPAPALGAGTGCSAPGLVSAWGDNSGPVAADSDGDLFAVMATSAGNQARAFAASSVARGAGPTDGVPLFTIAGYSGALAALSPTATDPGRVLFQPSDSSFTPLDVVQQQFTTSGGSLTTVGTPTAFLTVATGQSVSLLADDAQRLWVAISGTSSTTYVVLARH